jgi:TctA family transporter
LLFICIGVYSSHNDLFAVGETLVIGVAGYVLLWLGFHPAPLLLGFVLGSQFEENLRRALVLSEGDFTTFIERPISASFLSVAAVLIGAKLFFSFRRKPSAKAGTVSAVTAAE